MMTFLAKFDQRSFMTCHFTTYISTTIIHGIQSKCIWPKQNTTMTGIMYTSDLNIRAHDCNK